MEATLGLLDGNGSSEVSSNETKVEVLEQYHTSNPDETELELGLGLGLSLGVKVKPSACVKILTAKDFPSVLCNGFSSAAVSGTKRPADSAPQEAGSPPRSSQVVGWPPVRAYRMNSLVNQSKNPRAEDAKEMSKDSTLTPKGHIGFVKVNMDGIPIGRKVDLQAHACYQTLAQTLEDMFFKPATTSLHATESKDLPMKDKLSKLLDGSCEFVLTYEDKEGDWMLVGDVPWRMFISTVKRLRIMKTCEANGLAPRVQDKNEKQRRKPV